MVNFLARILWGRIRDRDAEGLHLDTYFTPDLFPYTPNINSETITECKCNWGELIQKALKRMCHDFGSNDKQK